MLTPIGMTNRYVLQVFLRTLSSYGGAAGLAAVAAGAGALVGAAAGGAGAVVAAGAGAGAAGLHAATTKLAPVTPSAVSNSRRLHAPPEPRSSCLSDIRCVLPQALGVYVIEAVLKRAPTSRARHHSNLRPTAALSASRR